MEFRLQPIGDDADDELARQCGWIGAAEKLAPTDPQFVTVKRGKVLQQGGEVRLTRIMP